MVVTQSYSRQHLVCIMLTSGCYITVNKYGTMPNCHYMGDKESTKVCAQQKNRLFMVFQYAGFRDTLHTHVHKCTPHMHVHMFISPWAYATHTLVAAQMHLHMCTSKHTILCIMLCVCICIIYAQKHTSTHTDTIHIHTCTLHMCTNACIHKISDGMIYTCTGTHTTTTCTPSCHAYWTRHERWVEYANTHGAKQ